VTGADEVQHPVEEVSGNSERALPGQVHGPLIMAHFAYHLA
jgi:hypothetical protein